MGFVVQDLILSIDRRRVLLALGSTPLSVYMALWVKYLGRRLITDIHIVPRLQMGRTVSLLAMCVIVCTGIA